jgi:hypothetical protein
LKAMVELKADNESILDKATWKNWSRRYCAWILPLSRTINKWTHVMFWSI